MMIRCRQKLIIKQVGLFFLSGLFLLGCAASKSVEQQEQLKQDHEVNSEAQPADKRPDAGKRLLYQGEQYAVSAMSKSGEYRFTLYSKVAPIPLKKIHSWVIKVENKNGEPIDNAKLFVFGGMPQHRHGFPTKPRVTENLGGGRYLVEGIKFSMPGYWEMRFNMKLNQIRDRVVFKIDLD